VRIAPGVNLDGVSFALWYAAAVADYVRQQMGLGEATITSGRDGTHTSGSVHARGDAIDVRTKDMPPEWRQPYADQVRAALGAEFFVTLETVPPHVHIQLGFENVGQRGLREYGLA
jgi:hypothetical protein